jgi:hypothetical protein
MITGISVQASSEQGKLPAGLSFPQQIGRMKKTYKQQAP